MYTTAEIIEVLVDKNYVVFQNDTKPYNLNYVGIRDTSGVNTFNDVFSAFWKYKGEWSNITWKGTTDPGTYWLEHPSNPHRANAKSESTQIDKWSAGCQVTANPNEYDVFIQVCKEAKEIWGEGLTYTLLNKNDFK